MFTFIVLPQGLEMIPHPVSLSWLWVDQSKFYPVSLNAKRRAASTIFNDFVMSRSGFEPVTARSSELTLYRLSYQGRSICTYFFCSEYAMGSYVQCLAFSSCTQTFETWPEWKIRPVVFLSTKLLISIKTTFVSLCSIWPSTCKPIFKPTFCGVTFSTPPLLLVPEEYYCGMPFLDIFSLFYNNFLRWT